LPDLSLLGAQSNAEHKVIQIYDLLSLQGGWKEKPERVGLVMLAQILHNIREEKLLQLVLWKMVHSALFLVIISINFSPSYSTVFFFIRVKVNAAILTKSL
jgi:hypothetical protein